MQSQLNSMTTEIGATRKEKKNQYRPTLNSRPTVNLIFLLRRIDATSQQI